MPVLDNLQYELVNPPNVPGSGFKFGRGTVVHVERLDVSDPEMVTNDEKMSREDGDRFGRDYFGGRILTFTINIRTVGSAHALSAAFERAWRTNDTGAGPSRTVAGRVSMLRMHRHGIPKRVYGRPRLWTPTLGRVDSGWVPITCTFKTVDHKFYSDVEQNNSITIVPPSSGGFTFPFTWPLATVPLSTQSDIVQINGTDDSWPVFRIWGPILNPIIDVVGYWYVKTNLQLLAGEWLDIDPRPWSRRVKKNDVQNASGVFTQDSRKLSGMWLPPGVHQIVLRGMDATGTARLDTNVLAAHSTW